ncbi:MAG: dTDP-4-amino-4,6-dideoxygalactose transaminase [Parvibaculum sp.]|uniref:dTDP-4-amino-4,6-dideoxygalactose transaminase n=1 Tax=Parvibaculum sp. TaxID=2024848 RepID=UPI003C779A48
MSVPYYEPTLAGREREYLDEVLSAKQLAGDGKFTKACHAWLEEKTGAVRALLTHSGTGALDMIGLLLEIEPGDEVIMPSYTFVSTANAIALRGGVPVFVDIRADTLNIDENLIEQAITPRTRAIMPVHYAGVGCEMDAIMTLAAKHGLAVAEDAAQGFGAFYRGKALGTFGALSALSFHASKNVVAGEGGALLVNDPAYRLRAEIVREKGTNRSQFFRGEVDKYTWVDLGSSFLPSEITAALLLAQLEQAEAINQRRVALWGRYHEALRPLEARGLARRAEIPQHCAHNGHIYWLVFESGELRARARDLLVAQGIMASAHYAPLHSSPAGQRLGRAASAMKVADHVGEGLLRMPLYAHMPDDVIERTAAALAAL